MPMKRNFINIVSLCLIFSSCRTADLGGRESGLKTDETLAVLRNQCDQFVPEESLDYQLRSLCECLDVQPSSGLVAKATDSFCTKAGAFEGYLTSLQKTLILESESGFRDSQNSPVDPDDKTCLLNMVESYKEFYVTMLGKTCSNRDLNEKALFNFLPVPLNEKSARCWRLSKMDANACMTASPCVGSGPSDISVLPLDQASISRWVKNHQTTFLSEGTEVALCNPRIQSMYKLKDPENVGRNYNLAFTNLLIHGRSYKNRTYAAANCHGTAQAVAGGILDQVEVSAITYHSEEVKNRCQELANKVYLDSSKASATEGSSFPVAGSLPVERGGHVINMNYAESCQESECGVTSFEIFECNQNNLEAYIFHNGMCYKCWSRLLQNAGLSPLENHANWQDLQPGCVLTTNDHSISLVMKNDGLCYYFETANPFGPPLLRVDTCPLLFNAFEKRWCPDTPLTFSVDE
jgi:hypothetical protein